MQSQNSFVRTPNRHNTDTAELVINKFERADFIFKVHCCQVRDELLLQNNKDEYLKAFPKSQRRYRYHSAIKVSIEHITSYEQNFKFLKNMKQKSDMNSEILLADCLDIYSILGDGPQKEAIYDLIGLIIQLQRTSVSQLRDSECEKIFRRIQNLVNLVNFTKRERLTSIEYQYKEENEGETKGKGNKMTNRIKFLLARFEFIIATLGHFIHYNKIANTLQKKVHSRAINCKSSNTVLTSVFTSMETRTKKDFEASRRQSSKSELKSASRKESLDGPVIAERIQSYREDNDEALTESKFQQVKAYFKWKLEKWKDQDLEEIVLVCRICSKSMFAKIMKKHSPHCKKVAEEERILKEFSKKINNITHQVTKEKHVINVDLMIEKKQLTSLRAAQLEESREQERPQSETSSESSEAPSITRAQTGFTSSFFDMPDSPNFEDSSNLKTPNFRDELKAFVNSNKNAERKENKRHTTHNIPLVFISAEKEIESPVEKEESPPNNSPPDFLLLPLSRQGSKKSIKTSGLRSRSQSRLSEDFKEELGEQNSINTSFERKKKDDTISPDQNDKLAFNFETKEVALLSQSTKSQSPIQNKKLPKLEVATSQNMLGSDLSPCLEPSFGQGFPLKRSNTSQIFLGSPLLSVSRRNSKKGDMLDSFQKRSSELQTLSALRERLEKIKVFQTLIKGYDIILQYAKTLDSFNEFCSEARVIFEEGRTEVNCFLDKVKNNTKFEDYSKEFIKILTEKLEYIKAIELSKKELKLLELANIETSESNKEDSGTNSNIQEVKSSFDSFEIMSNPEISPTLGLAVRKSVSISKTMASEFDKKRSTATPEDSPVTRKSRQLRSKSVGKTTNNLRYEMFEKNLQKVIKKLKKEKMEGNIGSPGKVNRSKFYRNSVFTPFYEEDPAEDDQSPKEEDSRRGSKMSSIKENNTRKNSSISESESESEDSDKSSSYKEEDLHNDIDLNIQITEKACFSDDESNIRRCAKKQEEGFSSLITINDFEFIKLISKGAYGRVWLVRRKITGDHYAMKIINFADRKNMNQIDSLKTEKKVFEKLKGDFVVKAVFTFVHNSYLCIVMEFMIGGDFGHILEKLGAMEEDDARFYIAEIVLALDNLHQLDIVHRDLKPDNILLNKNGHIKLTDFGLSEVGVQKHTKVKKAAKRNSIFNSLTAKTTATLDRRLSLMVPTTTTTPILKKIPEIPKPTPAILSDEFSTIPEVDEEAAETAPRNGNRVIGTPDYMAPEVINGTCYDDPCIDWWSVGVLLFEFIVGIPPFNDPNIDVVFENIVKRKIPWDELQIGYDEGCITPEAKDLIDRLLETDRTKRLGAKGIEEIKSHDFFKKINWDEILKSKAPIIPVTENDIDVSNFEKENKKYLQSELENPFFHEKANEGTHSVSINKENFELARVDILHEENEKVVQEATNTISQEELEKMRKARLVNRKWSVFD